MFVSIIALPFSFSFFNRQSESVQEEVIENGVMVNQLLRRHSCNSNHSQAAVVELFCTLVYIAEIDLLKKYKINFIRLPKKFSSVRRFKGSNPKSPGIYSSFK